MTKAKAGDRLPYLLSKLKAPRVLERLEQTAALAREQEWPYERFLETLLEAELRRLERYHLLVVDEVGYLPLERQAANLLFALVSRRYERGSDHRHQQLRL